MARRGLMDILYAAAFVAAVLIAFLVVYQFVSALR
jgi:hypothetical protein